MGLTAVLPAERKQILGLHDEELSCRHPRQRTALPRPDNRDPAPREDPGSCSSLRPGVDRVLGSSSSREAFRQAVRCHPLVLKHGLSRMPGDLHVRFLGGSSAARRCCYPTAWYAQRAPQARRQLSLSPDCYRIPRHAKLVARPRAWLRENLSDCSRNSFLRPISVQPPEK